jgi:hypothetical protein
MKRRATNRKKKKVKICHAIALALVGWYLMTPPDGKSSVSFDKWSHSASFDSAKECEAARIFLYQSAKADLPKQSGDFLKSQMLLSEMMAECIQTDDPRLKGN